MLVTGGLVGVAGGGAANAATGHQDWGAAAQFVGQINGARSSHARTRLAVSSALTSVAASWAATMARSNRLAHNPGLARSVSGWKVLGENVGVGPSVSSLESAFYNSAEHRANMLDSEFTLVGVAVVDVGDKLWVVEVFERPSHVGSTRAGRSSQQTLPLAGPSRHGAAGHTRKTVTALERARQRQLWRLFDARHDPVVRSLTVHTVRERTQLPGH